MGEKTRALNKAELKRKSIFEAREEILYQEGYKKKELTIGIVKANVMALLIMIPVVGLLFMIYSKLNGGFEIIANGFMDKIILLIVFIILIILHELIHGITWAIYSKNHFRDIEFGVIWGMLTPYCACKSELTKKQYIIGAIMPTILIGIIPAVVAIVFHIDILLLHSLIMILAGGGDVIIVSKLLLHREKGKESMYLDHPYECGVVVFEKAS